MSNFITWSIVEGALELGLIYALIALALFLTYSMLNVCDLSTDGCYTLGCATGAVVAIAGHPILALFAAMGVGVLSGLVNAFLQTRMNVESMLAGIIVNTGLYTINLAIMGKSVLSMNDTDTLFTRMKSLLDGTPLSNEYKFLLAIIFAAAVIIFMLWFLGTRLGLSIRATGDNQDMVKSSSINPAVMKTIGLCIGGALTALSGCLIGEYQKSCDINMGTGMVTVALASLIIGETIFGKRSVRVRVIGVVFGSCLYRVIVAIALRMNLPASALKLVSAVIVAIAISMPAIRSHAQFKRTKIQAMARRRAAKEEK